VLAGETLDLGDVRLDAQAHLVVRLRAAEGIDVGAAELLLNGGSGGCRTWERDQQQRLRSQPVSAGSYVLEVWGKDTARVRREVDLAAGADAEVEVELVKAPSVRLEFVPQDRERERWVDAMQIWLEDAGGRQLDHRMLQVDGAKTFVWQRGLVPGSYRLRA